MASRVDEHGRAYKKSQLQMQVWVNRRQKALTAAVLKGVPSLGTLAADLTWVSPLEQRRFVEHFDTAFLVAVERPELADALKKFWPSGGPHWDALAIARAEGGEPLGPVLVEAKSHPREMRSKLSATDPDSRRRILKRLTETRAWLGVSDEHSDAWSKRWYQASNRFAHLRWFRDVVGEPAWLVNVYFLNDPDHATTRQQWDDALAGAYTDLGLADVAVPFSGNVFLEAGTRDELLSAATDHR